MLWVMTTRPYTGRQPALYAALDRLRTALDPWSSVPKDGLVDAFKAGLQVMVDQGDLVAVRVAESFRTVETVARLRGWSTPGYLAMIADEMARMDADATPIGPTDQTEWCVSCRTRRRIVDQFDAVTRAYGRMDTYWVTILECSHSTSARRATEPAEGAPYVDPIDYP